jgi:tRNA(fMet)-specific endonuclease VapC
MSLFILDTDTLTLLREQHPTVSQRRAACVAPDVAAVSVEEQLTGWLSLLRRRLPRDRLAWVYEQMADAAAFLSGFPILPFPETAILRYEQLIALRLNVGRMDLRIGAIALEAGGIAVTRNRRDFARIPGLPIVDWTV